MRKNFLSLPFNLRTSKFFRDSAIKNYQFLDRKTRISFHYFSAKSQKGINENKNRICPSYHERLLFYQLFHFCLGGVSKPAVISTQPKTQSMTSFGTQVNPFTVIIHAILLVIFVLNR